MTDSSGQVVETSIVPATFASEVQTSVTTSALATIATIIPGKAPEVDRLTTVAADLSFREPSQSPYRIKRDQGDSLSTLTKGGSSKQACLLEDVESGALTHFFQFPAILPSQVPNTLK